MLNECSWAAARLQHMWKWFLSEGGRKLEGGMLSACKGGLTLSLVFPTLCPIKTALCGSANLLCALDKVMGEQEYMGMGERLSSPGDASALPGVKRYGRLCPHRGAPQLNQGLPTSGCS